VVKKMRLRGVVFDDVDNLKWHRRTLQTSGYDSMNLRLPTRYIFNGVLVFLTALGSDDAL
jgi:hypothetical protein